MRYGADNCQELERLCRYISRLAVANERVQCNAAGQVVLTLKTPWRDGTTHLVMSPLEFMQRLAARGATPAAAPDALLSRANAHRRAACAGGPVRTRGRRPGSQAAECEANCAHHRPVALALRLADRLAGELRQPVASIGVAAAA